MTKYRTDSTDRLLNAILELNSLEECYSFFEDLCTIKEIQDMAQRLDTAILLDKGVSYSTISKTVGISTATISRVNRCLTYGDGGYKKAIDKINNKENKDADK